jgi:hypothetical protein
MFMSARRTIVVMVLLTLALILSPADSSASTLQGSSLTLRTDLDAASGQVFIYAGGFFEIGEKLTTFSWLSGSFSGTRFMTPLLFEEASPGVFTVRGIGAGESVTSSGSPQSFNFNVQQGTDTTSSGLFVFGFINALVNSNGQQTASSTGTVSFNIGIDPGNGAGGPGTTNDWVFTPTIANISVALGTTFGTPGHPATYTLNGVPDEPDEDPSCLLDRTYSATQNGVLTGVPEPGTFALFAIGAGLLLAGLLRKAYRA